MSRSALSRHKRNCIATAMAAAGAVCDEITAERLVLELRQLRFVTLSVLDDARSAKDHGAALRAIARLEAQAELVGRLAGELVERHQVESIAVVVDAQWIALRSCILSVLADYPDALHAVVAALRDVDRVPA